MLELLAPFAATRDGVAVDLRRRHSSPAARPGPRRQSRCSTGMMTRVDPRSAAQWSGGNPASLWWGRLTSMRGGCKTNSGGGTVVEVRVWRPPAARRADVAVRDQRSLRSGIAG